jgi:hypothetical protein
MRVTLVSSKQLYDGEQAAAAAVSFVAAVLDEHVALSAPCKHMV